MKLILSNKELETKEFTAVVFALSNYNRDTVYNNLEVIFRKRKTISEFEITVKSKTK